MREGGANVGVSSISSKCLIFNVNSGALVTSPELD